MDFLRINQSSSATDGTVLMREDGLAHLVTPLCPHRGALTPGRGVWIDQGCPKSVLEGQCPAGFACFPALTL